MHLPVDGVKSASVGTTSKMNRPEAASSARRPCDSAFVHWTIAFGFIMLLAPVPVESQLAPCIGESDPRSVANTLLEIERSVDPCGESADVIAVIEELRRCRRAPYRICSDLEARRNVFDRPTTPQGALLPRTITWNPQLRSELELGCDGDPRKPVLRDPAASLLHELVHAAQDCAGLNPGEHELEAVRIENIYRRAAGLCQRRSYGDDPLPVDMVKLCRPGQCSCATPTEASAQRVHMQLALPDPSRRNPSSGAAQGVDRNRRGD